MTYLMALDSKKLSQDDQNVRNVLKDFSYDEMSINEVIDARTASENLTNIPALSKKITQNAKFLYIVLAAGTGNKPEEIQEYLTHVAPEKLYKNKMDLDMYLDTVRKDIYYTALNIAEDDIEVDSSISKAIRDYQNLAPDMREISAAMDKELEKYMPEISQTTRLQPAVNGNSSLSKESYLERIYKSCGVLSRKSRHALYTLIDAIKADISTTKWDKFTYVIDSDTTKKIIQNIKNGYNKNTSEVLQDKMIITSLYKNMSQGSVHIEPTKLKYWMTLYKTFVSQAHADYLDQERRKSNPGVVDHLIN